jgi:hypothetical protein
MKLMFGNLFQSILIHFWIRFFGIILLKLLFSGEQMKKCETLNFLENIPPGTCEEYIKMIHLCFNIQMLRGTFFGEKSFAMLKIFTQLIQNKISPETLLENFQTLQVIFQMKLEYNQ